MSNPTLAEVMAYQNPHVVERFIKIYGVGDDEAQVLFEDVKRWLWMANQVHTLAIRKPLVIDTALVVIDEMWHNFVLFTREYTQFCDQFFGHYMHHAPNTLEEIEREKASTQGMTLAERRQLMMDKKRWQYEFVYDHLGEETFIRWYKQYPKRYTAQSLAEMAYRHETARNEAHQREIDSVRSQMAGAA